MIFPEADAIGVKTFEIGGKYSALTNEFILASINPNPDHTTVVVEGYEIKMC